MFAKFKRVLTNKSALSCLSGTLFRIVLPIMGALFGAAFFRTYWGLPRNTASINRNGLGFRPAFWEL